LLQGFSAHGKIQVLVDVSRASAWEIASNNWLGKLPEAKEAVENLPRLLRDARIESLPITVSMPWRRALCPDPTATPSTGCRSPSPGLKTFPF
jgi:PIN domain nuclease of toxin-antitoxin system